jgi:hypothetical protein
MKIIPFPSRHKQQAVQFRCYACRVAFTPTADAITHCEQCTAGMQLHAALLSYRRVAQQGRRS